MKVRPNRRLLGAGIAAIVGWLPAYTAGFVNVPAHYDLPVVAEPAVLNDIPAAPVQEQGKRRKKAKCAECGSIVSVREIAGNDGEFQHAASGGLLAKRRIDAPAKKSARHEITIRLGDGSTHVISSDSPASWRAGERVILIAGANLPVGRRAQSWAR